ncbi:MAG: DUF4832 domain-containing protein, partial [Candidatus Poribacteria bacterium]
PSTSAYFRLYWRDIEPNDGEIDFAQFDDLLARAKQAGQKLAFRVMCVGTNRDSIHVPEWLRELGCPGWEFRYHDRDLVQWAPDMDSELFQDRHFRLIRALGERYDGHPDLDLVDIGTVGLWGEWHMSGTGVDMPSDDTRRRIIETYMEAFPTTPKVMLIGDADGMRQATSAGAGWRADCLGDVGGFSDTWNHMDDMYPAQVRDTDAEDAWLRGPVAFETCWDMRKWAEEGWDIRGIYDYALSYHASYVNNKSAPIPDGGLPQVERMLRRVGYRLVLRSATYDPTMTANDDQTVEMTWENVGVAPPYLDYRVALRLRPERGNGTMTGVSAVTVQGWAPGEHVARATIVSSPRNKPGAYRLEVALVSAVTGVGDTLPVAIAGRMANGWYPLGEVTVEDR